MSRDTFLAGTSSSSESEYKRLSPDRRNINADKNSSADIDERFSGKTSPRQSEFEKEDDSELFRATSSTLIAKKMSPLKEKRVSFEAKEEEEVKLKRQGVTKSREDSLPPPDFEENYLIAQSDILRQASIEYDRRMQEHKEMMKRMRQEQHFDERMKPEFPDFETWMEKREKEEPRTSNLEESQKHKASEQNELDSEKNEPTEISNAKSFSASNLRKDILLEVSVEESVDSPDKNNGNNGDGESASSVREDDKEEEKLSYAKTQVESIRKKEIKTNEKNLQSFQSDKEAEIFARIREMITRDYLLQSQESLKDLDISSIKELVEADRKDLIKQNSLKEMRRELEKKWLESKRKVKPEMRRRSEEKNMGSDRVKPFVVQRRSLSFDEEILI